MTTTVVALGGNAIQRPGQAGTFDEQLQAIQDSCAAILRLVEMGYRTVVTHGNGPQVGNLLIQNEESSVVVPSMPLHACVAQTQGQLGYMLQQSLGEALAAAGLENQVVTLITQVEVNPDDPAFQQPAKPVGSFYTEQRARRLMRDRHYVMREDSGRGWRRVVPSPQPLRIVEGAAVRKLVDQGIVVIAGGGGGVPVARNAAGCLYGVDAVIDKDLAAQQLGQDLDADLLIILTDVDQVMLNFGLPDQRPLRNVPVREMEVYQQEGHFRSGSMGPKVEAAVRFVRSNPEKRKAVIGSLRNAAQLLSGETGTWILP